MIHNLRVTKYRLFDDLVVDPLKRINLIVGANNVGKTTLLEAIYLLAGQDKRKNLATILLERGEFLVDTPDAWRVRNYPSPLSFPQIEGYLITQLFHGRTPTSNGGIQIQSSLPHNLLSLSVKNGQNQGSSTHSLTIEYQQDATGAHTEKIALENGVLPVSSSKLDFLQIGNTQLITTNQIDYAQMASLWDRIVLTPLEERVIEALRLLEPAIERISFTASRTSQSGILVRLRGQATPIPLDSMGDGVRRLLAIILSLVGIGDGTLLIDEIDTGLYYAALKDIWRVIIETAVKQDAQLFATTHSWDCVRAFQQALYASHFHNEGTLIRLDREGEQVKVTTYSADELDIAIPQGIEVR